MKPRPFIGVLVGGASAATLDLLYAFIAASQSGRSPLRVLHAIASGLLGAAAFTGGAEAALSGLAAHFVILLVAAVVYLVASRHMPLLREQPVFAGLAFGVCVFIFMNVIVLPLSATPFTPEYSALVLLEGLAVHAILVGLPIAIAIWYFCFRRPDEAPRPSES